MKIVLFGAGGMIGSRIASELTGRGHEVIPASRSTGTDVTDPQAVAATARGADAVVSAVAARSGDFTLAEVARSLHDGLRSADVRRLVVVGGAASLEVAPGQKLFEAPDFPEEWKAEAMQGMDSLEVYRTFDDLDWTWVSPAAFIHPGERTGRYRIAGDQLLTGEDGNSEISAEDYAIAIADLVESGEHARERVHAAW
jgi:putative NADH-flavin reductase